MLEDMERLEAAVADCDPEIIIHLAAQAGVRYSLEHPEAYVSSNLVGTFNVMQMALKTRPKHLLVASTSSVYGGNQQMPFREEDRADHPLTLYAATKKAGEAMTHAYAHLWGIPTTCFRFFTVYGPWGRPDMAPIKFIELIEAGRPIEVYGEGRMQRDFTFIDDLVEGIVRLVGVPPVKGEPVTGEGVSDSLSPVAPWRVVNIGAGRPEGLMDLIGAIEEALGKTADKIMRPMQPGDPAATFADATLLRALTGYAPSTPLAEGIAALVKWYRKERAGA
jgi:UDP-glucuronate 4-epimerase